MKLKISYHYMLLLPTIAILIFLSVVPLGFLGLLNFVSWRLGEPWSNMTFVGGYNFQWMLFGGDKEYWHSFYVTILFSVLTTLIEFPLGFGLAVLLNRKLKGETIIKTMLIIPLSVTPVIMGLVWKLMLNYDYGVFSYFLKDIIGLGINWFSFENALWAIILIDVWSSLPFITLSLLSGLQSLSKSPYEAAQIDGASTLQIFRHITLPSIAPVAYMILFLKVISALGAYGVPFIVTGGGPALATEVLSIHVQRIGFGRLDMGKGSVIATSLTVLTMVVLAVMIKLTKFGAEKSET
jgi:ABC-type sugar transport system permease subunit